MARPRQLCKMPKPTNVCSTLPRGPIQRKASGRAWKMQGKDGPGRQGSFLTSSNPHVAYLVNITARAERDLALLYEEIDAGSSSAARKWYQGLKQAILGLEDQP